MEQSQKDAATKTAWITGGFALAATLITLLFSGGGIRGPATGAEPPPPSSMTSSNVLVENEPSPPIPTPTTLVPSEVVGDWYGGLQGDTNLHLQISESADYFLLDAGAPGRPNRGKVSFKGAIIDLNDNNGNFARFPWSIEQTPQGDVLHIGVVNYRRK